MLDGRKRITTIIAACGATALGASLLIAAPTQANPDIDDVKVRVERLYHQAEQASERYNDARVEFEDTQARLKTLRADLARQEQRVDLVREQVASTVVAQYQGSSLSTSAQAFLSTDTDQFLDQLMSRAAFDDQQAQLMAEFGNQVKQLELRQAAAERELAEISKIEQRLADEKAEIEENTEAVEATLAELEAEEAARVVAPSRSAERPALTDVAVSGRAGAAVEYALAQVGDAYVYGASGPDAFDCSGLTMMAWAQAGVSLPHSSSGQMSSGPSVASSSLQPGDLVFYYSPVSHVGIYIGNGQIVHAANPSTGVEIVGVFSMPYSGAVRPG